MLLLGDEACVSLSGAAIAVCWLLGSMAETRKNEERVRAGNWARALVWWSLRLAGIPKGMLNWGGVALQNGEKKK